MNAYHASGVPTLIAVESDGSTLINIEADPNTHVLSVSAGITGTDNGPSYARHDNSHVPVLVATSNADGKTPVVVYADSSGNLLVDGV